MRRGDKSLQRPRGAALGYVSVTSREKERSGVRNTAPEKIKSDLFLEAAVFLDCICLSKASEGCVRVI